MKKSNALLWGVLGLLLAAVCVVALYRAWPLLFPEVATLIPADPACDLRAGPCTSTLDSDSRVSFAIEPREIPLVKPLQLRVELQGLEARQVEVDFSGVDMNMGFNRFKLSATGAGGFTGEGMLPVCVRDAMEWEARVLISTPSGLKAVAYRFVTVRSGMPLPGRTPQTTH
ncbi:MAG: hypothetical protein P8166_04200 [Candidatus Thiodiazotropha sp.]|jgi:hypothetical protein